MIMLTVASLVLTVFQPLESRASSQVQMQPQDKTATAEIVSQPLFNQDELLRAWSEFGSFISLPVSGDAAGVPSGVDETARARQALDPSDPDSMLAFVLASAPARPVVFPTEGYFYFTFDLGSHAYAGNLRFDAIREGELSFAYYQPDNISTLTWKLYHQDDGLDIHRLDDDVYRLTFAGVGRDFLLPTFGFESLPEIQLLDHESIVSGVLDESGVQFTLLFNEVMQCFYYVLDETRVRADDFNPMQTTAPLDLGERTGFILYRDEVLDRRVLVGVSQQEIRANSPFDGPFDQVPPNLPIQERLERAYPYVTSRGGIDAHGNFIEMVGERVAISPYRPYVDVTDVERFVLAAEAGSLTHSDLLASITYEPKRDFHLLAAHFTQADTPWAENEEPIWVKQGWPANHKVGPSMQFPASHTAPISREGAPDSHSEVVTELP